MSNDTKHTPGPWEISECGGCDVWDILNDDLDSPLTAHCYGSVVEGGIEHESDARLIAAAPDMLEALHRLIAQCTLLAMSGHGNSEAAESFREIIRPVIAKAEGKTK